MSASTTSVIAKLVQCGQCFDRNWDGRADNLGVLREIEFSDSFEFFERRRTSSPWYGEEGPHRSSLANGIVIGTRRSPSVWRSFVFRCRSGHRVGVSAARLRKLFDRAGDTVMVR